MSWLGDVIGDRAPNLKNIHNVLLAKIAQNNLGGKIKYAWRGFKASVTDAKDRFVHKFQDFGLHFKRLNHRQVKLLDMLEKGYVPTEKELKAMYSDGDAAKAEMQANAVFKVVTEMQNVMPEIVKAAKERVDDEAKGLTNAQKARDLATAIDNMKVIEAESKFAQMHPHWRKDWDRHLIVFGEVDKGVFGVANHFRQKYADVAHANGGVVSSTMHDAMLVGALQKNLVELQEHQENLNKELEAHLQDAQEGKPINPERLKRLQAAAAFDAIDYINRCLAKGEEADALRAGLLSKYSSAFGLDSSINADLGEQSTVGARAEYNAKIASALDELQRRSNVSGEE